MSERNPGLGRRGEALKETARIVVVKASVGQSRKTRRNNLRLARIEARVPSDVRKEAKRRAEARERHETEGTAT